MECGVGEADVSISSSRRCRPCICSNRTQYVVQDAKVQIVDEYTGRIMADRSWSAGCTKWLK